MISFDSVQLENFSIFPSYVFLIIIDLIRSQGAILIYRCSFLVGKLNVVAEEESRAFTDVSDWRLEPSILIYLVLEILLWTCLLSHGTQLPTFISWKLRPGMFTVNAFSINWSNWSAYAFPSFSLSKCLQKIRPKGVTFCSFVQFESHKLGFLSFWSSRAMSHVS